MRSIGSDGLEITTKRSKGHPKQFDHILRWHVLWHCSTTLVEFIEYHVRIESFTGLSWRHETLINWQEEMCIVGVPQCWPEPVSSEIIQVLTSQLSGALVNTFYVVREMCGILKSVFVLFLLQNCHWRPNSNSNVLRLPYCLEKPLKEVGSSAEEGGTFPTSCHFLMTGRNRWSEISLKNRGVLWGER